MAVRSEGNWITGLLSWVRLGKLESVEKPIFVERPTLSVPDPMQKYFSQDLDGIPTESAAKRRPVVGPMLCNDLHVTGSASNDDPEPRSEPAAEDSEG